jgi:hypothetical protein
MGIFALLLFWDLTKGFKNLYYRSLKYEFGTTQLSCYKKIYWEWINYGVLYAYGAGIPVLTGVMFPEIFTTGDGYEKIFLVLGEGSVIWVWICVLSWICSMVHKLYDYRGSNLNYRPLLALEKNIKKIIAPNKIEEIKNV